MSALGGRHFDAVVVGGGQAGLATSHQLKQRGIDHVVLEKNRVAHEWRERRWDTFCLVTPNWQCQLPGFPYRGPDPFGFMKRDEIVRYLEDYVRAFQPPLCEGVEVTALRRAPSAGFELCTSAGDLTADEVVVATGGYHRPAIPRIGERLSGVLQLHSAHYRNPEALPPGAVLVVGSGQSGCQIAEDLHLAGRQVFLCVGRAPRTARRYRGRDVVEWLHDMGYYSLPVHEHPLKERVRGKANHYVTGRDGGRDIDLRQRAREGMQLCGRLVGIEGGQLRFADDLRQNLDQADAVAESIKTSIDKFIAEKGVDAPVEARYVPVWEPGEPRQSLDLAGSGISAVIWCTGFSPDYGWIELPAFDGKGQPAHQRGLTSVEGLSFIGLPWLYTWGSGRFSGVAQDAAYICDHIAARLGARAPVPPSMNELALGS